MVNVGINQGKHSISVPKGTEQQIGDFLQQLGLEGGYSGCLGKKIRGSGHKKGEVKPLRVKGHTITLAVQPGDNGTRFEVHVYMDGRDAEAIFSRMLEYVKEKISQDDKTKTATGSCETENTIPDSARENGNNFEDVEKGEDMTEKKQATWFKAKKFLEDKEIMHLILLALVEKKEKDGTEGLQSGACVKALRESGLIGREFDEKAVGRIFPMLAEMGYLVATPKRGYYQVAEKTLSLLEMTQAPEQKPVAVSLKENELTIKTQARVALITQYTLIESEFLKVKAKHDELEEQLKKLSVEIKADLK